MNISKLLLLWGALVITALGLSACENTYKGAGRDLGIDEMEDGWE